MKEIQFCKVTILAIAFLTSNIQGSVIRFQAYPSVLKTNLTSSASMRCSLANTGASSNQIGKRSVTTTANDVLHISAIYITNSNGDDVAAISPFDAPVAYVDIGNLDVKGDVSGTSSEGYLELSWRDPSAMSIGGYECNIHCSDKHHHPVVFSATIEITEEAPTIYDVISELKYLNQKQSTKISNQKAEITDLKKQQTALKNCAAKRVGFMAIFTKIHTITSQQPVVFDKVLYNQGGSYSNVTGEFVCSEPGIYSFRIHALSSHNNDISLNLMLNSNIVTSAYSYGNSRTVEAAAAGALLHLNANDRVQVVTDVGYTSDFYEDPKVYHGNVFIGQMEQSDCAL